MGEAVKFTYAGCTYEARSSLSEADFTESKGLAQETLFEVHLVLTQSSYLIGWFSLSPFPGCCAIVVSHSASLKPEYRGTYHSEPFRQIKQFVAQKLGYSMMVATTITGDIPAFKSFLKAHYRVDATWTNPRTSNQLALGHKLIQ